eukprot:Rhum_TRINITY_DN15445_c1_g1::Rhum_TRINITY_DN15445_c1_g1_i1::g.158202::m.158202
MCTVIDEILFFSLFSTSLEGVWVGGKGRAPPVPSKLILLAKPLRPTHPARTHTHTHTRTHTPTPDTRTRAMTHRALLSQADDQTGRGVSALTFFECTQYFKEMKGYFVLFLFVFALLSAFPPPLHPKPMQRYFFFSVCSPFLFPSILLIPLLLLFPPPPSPFPCSHSAALSFVASHTSKTTHTNKRRTNYKKKNALVFLCFSSHCTVATPRPSIPPPTSPPSIPPSLGSFSHSFFRGGGGVEGGRNLPRTSFHSSNVVLFEPFVVVAVIVVVFYFILPSFFTFICSDRCSPTSWLSIFFVTYQNKKKNITTPAHENAAFA